MRGDELKIARCRPHMCERHQYTHRGMHTQLGTEKLGIFCEFLELLADTLISFQERGLILFLFLALMDTTVPLGVMLALGFSPVSFRESTEWNSLSVGVSTAPLSSVSWASGADSRQRTGRKETGMSSASNNQPSSNRTDRGQGSLNSAAATPARMHHPSCNQAKQTNQPGAQTCAVHKGDQPCRVTWLGANHGMQAAQPPTRTALDATRLFTHRTHRVFGESFCGR